MWKLVCRIFGHKIERSDLHRSPHTVYTHWRDVKCTRCGEDFGIEREYIDARTHPELFRTKES
jgi:hypothetical protein